MARGFGAAERAPLYGGGGGDTSDTRSTISTLMRNKNLSPLVPRGVISAMSAGERKELAEKVRAVESDFEKNGPSLKDAWDAHSGDDDLTFDQWKEKYADEAMESIEFQGQTQVAKAVWESVAPVIAEQVSHDAFAGLFNAFRLSEKEENDADLGSIFDKGPLSGTYATDVAEALDEVIKAHVSACIGSAVKGKLVMSPSDQMTREKYNKIIKNVFYENDDETKRPFGELDDAMDAMKDGVNKGLRKLGYPEILKGDYNSDERRRIAIALDSILIGAYKATRDRISGV